MARLSTWLNRFKTLPKGKQAMLALGGLAAAALVFSLAGVSGTESGGKDAFAYSAGLAAGVFLKLGLVVLLILGAALVLRNWKGTPWRTALRQMTVIETLHLTPRRALHLIRVGQRVLLIGATDQSIALLGEMEADTAAEGRAAEAGGGTAFADLLAFSTQRAEFPGGK